MSSTLLDAPNLVEDLFIGSWIEFRINKGKVIWE